MERVQLSHEGASVEVCLHGAHVVSWKNAGGEELMFVSSKALFEPPKAIRGGVPICFPQFGMLGPMPSQHGFARNTAFTVETQTASSVTLALHYDGHAHATFPHPFILRTTIAITGPNSFSQDLQVHNSGDSVFTFTCALHTYYRVSDISKVKVLGLQGNKYLDNLQAMKEEPGSDAPVSFSGEVDRIYVAAPDAIQIEDGSRSFEIVKGGFSDAVVWNPWVDKAAKMADFGDDEYKVMLCIEPAVAASGPVSVAPGSTWRGYQNVSYKQ